MDHYLRHRAQNADVRSSMPVLRLGRAPEDARLVGARLATAVAVASIMVSGVVPAELEAGAVSKVERESQFAWPANC